jgi:hypothetical protein
VPLAVAAALGWLATSAHATTTVVRTDNVARTANFYIGSVPPSAADRRGLLSAFHRVHGARTFQEHDAGLE